MRYNGKKLLCGDDITFVSGVDNQGEKEYSYGKIVSFSGRGKELFVHINKYGKNKQYVIVKHEDVINVSKEKGE
jgi:hypothetical protein